MSAEPLDLATLPGLTTQETHGSRVYLSGDRAYKLRKPVRFPFLDQTEVGTRRELAATEVRINQELAPSTYLGVIDAVVGGGPTEPVVEMRRFREDDTLARRLETGRADPELLEHLGRRVAEFHAAAPGRPGGGTGATLAALQANAQELAGDLRAAHPAPDLWRILRPLQAAILRGADELDARAAAGHWVEGHGDLRADHVVSDEHGLQIVDRLEFDAALRTTDAGDDLAFLLMDLESRGAQWAADVVATAYRDAGGDPGSPALQATWSANRALVSAKVALLRGQQAAGGRHAERAARLLALAEQLAWRTRTPRVYVVCGPPASGKSTVAAELAACAELPVVSSDVVRKRGSGLDPADRAPGEAYARERTVEVYRELGEQAAQQLVTGGGVIVDATMGASQMRAAFAEALAGAGRPVADGRGAPAPGSGRSPGAPPLYIECRVPAGVAEQRARDRMADPAAVSDATPQVAARLAAAWEPLDEVPPADHMVVRADRAAAEIVEEVARRLDAV